MPVIKRDTSDRSMRLANRQWVKCKELIGVRLRRKRFSFFLSLLDSLNGPVAILDVGGTRRFWETMEFVPSNNTEITLLNRHASELSTRLFKSIIGDACQMPFADNEFDVVFSNSVLEHVGDHINRLRMAKEIRRVGKRYFVQTPNRYFPIEPHFALPFFQFLPLALKVWLLTLLRLKRFKQLRKLPTIRNKVRRGVQSIHLLCHREVEQLFPEATMKEERFCGLVKSFIAYHGWEQLEK